MPEEPDYTRILGGTWKLITIVILVFGVILFVGGVLVAIIGTQAETTFVFLGQEFNSTSVGVSLAFIGAVMSYFVIKRLLTSVDAAIGSDKRGRRGNEGIKERDVNPQGDIAEAIRLNERGTEAFNKGQYREALNYFQQGLDIRREVRDRVGEGATLNNIGEVYRNQGLYEQALKTYQDALVISREVGNRAGEGATLNNIGSVYAHQGLYAQALKTYNQALVISREVRDRVGEGTTLNNIGLVYDNQGLYAQALKTYNQALVIAREIGSSPMEETILDNIKSLPDD